MYVLWQYGAVPNGEAVEPQRAAREPPAGAGPYVRGPLESALRELRGAAVRKLGLLILLLVAAAQAQTEIDWKPCQAVVDQFKEQIEKFNTEHHDGTSINAYCQYNGDPKRVAQPKRKVPLAANEIVHLHELRAQEHAILTSVTEYEDYLIRAHHIRQYDIGSNCYNFVGFVLDDDYITVDPNPMMAEPEMHCNYEDTK